MIKENKLIAEFMGMQPTKIGWFDYEENMSEYACQLVGGNTFEELQYDRSWDWLMPVVREILITIELDSLYYDTEELRYNTLDCDISGAYKEIVEFIMEYNLKNSMEETEEVSIFDIFINLTSKTNK